MRAIEINASSVMQTGPESPHVPRDYKRPKAAAAYLQIGVSTLWRWVAERDGFPKPVKAGPRVTLFDMGAIADFLRTAQR